MLKQKLSAEAFVKIAFGVLFLALSIQMVFFNRVFGYGIVLQVVLVAGLAALLVCVLYVLQKNNAEEWLIRQRYRLLLCCVVFLFVVQSVVSYQTYQLLDHDIGKVFNGAVLYVNEPQHPDYYQYENYINHWSNNAGIFVLFVGLVRVLNFFGMDAYYQAAALVGQLFFSGALVFTFLYLQKAYSALAAVFSLFCWLSFPVVYLQASSFYTDTYSLMFVPLSMYLLWHARKPQSVAKRLLFSFLAGLSLFCGMQIKATVLFVALAMLIEVLMKRERLSHLFCITACVVCVMLVLNTVANVVKHNIVLDEDKLEATDTPAIFWVMMGLSSESGEFNADDEDAVRPFTTQTEKQAYCLQVIETRLEEKGVLGTLDFMVTKASRTFGSGDADIDYMLSRGPLYPNRFVYQLILPSGQYYAIFNNVNQAVYVFLNVLMAVGAFFSLREKKHGLYAVYIALCGFFVFMLLWESNHRQLVNQWPLYFMGAAVGAQQVYQFLKNNQNKKKNGEKNGETHKNLKIE